MVTGCLPWAGDTLSEQMDNLIHVRYTCHNTTSKSCQNLIASLLSLDPKKRATIEEVRKHPWVNEGFQGPPPSTLPPRKALTLTEIDNEILVKMKEIGFTVAEVVSDLKSNAVTKQSVIMYHLLVISLQHRSNLSGGQ